MVIPAIATESGGNSGGWVQGDNGVFNINPTAKNGDMGFRKYEKFDLSAGDIANLIMKYGVLILNVS